MTNDASYVYVLRYNDVIYACYNAHTVLHNEEIFHNPHLGRLSVTLWKN